MDLDLASCRTSGTTIAHGALIAFRWERVEVSCFDQMPLQALFLRSRLAAGPSAAAIWISDEDETTDALLDRILPTAMQREISLLLVAFSDLTSYPSQSSDGKITPNMLLECCFDDLACRADVDAKRIAVIGENLASVLAGRFAAYDRRVVAAVCDGGLWDSMRAEASIEWLVGADRTASEFDRRRQRSRMARRINCPFLVVAGEGGVAGVDETIELHADCRALGVEMDFQVSAAAQTLSRGAGNFVRADELVFDWLERRMVRDDLPGGAVSLDIDGKLSGGAFRILSDQV